MGLPEVKASAALSPGHLIATEILSRWIPGDIASGCLAAVELGWLSDTVLTDSRAYHILTQNLEWKKIPEERRDEIRGHFHQSKGNRTKEEVLTYFAPKVAAPGVISFEPSPFTWRDPKAIPPRDWIYGRHLLRRHVSATIASGAVGKTSLKIVEALAMATGKPLLGKEVPQRARVWLFNLEDDRDEIDRRVIAAMTYYKINPEDVADYLFVEGETPLIITATDRNGTKIRRPVVDGLIDAIKRRSVDVLIVDPFVSSHDAPESDNGAIDVIVKHGWVNVAREGGCAVDIAHHTTKADATSGTATAMSARGAGSFIAACRSVQVLNPMLPEEASKAGLPSPGGYFKAFGDKQNLTPKTGLPDWYKMEGMDLGNAGEGNLAFMRSDSVGVVTSWEWPTSGSFVSDVTKDQLQGIKNRLTFGQHRKDPQSKSWAGHIVGEILGIDTSIKAEKQRVTKMLETWVGTGDLREYKAKDEYRAMRDFIGKPDDC